MGAGWAIGTETGEWVWRAWGEGQRQGVEWESQNEGVARV